LAKQSTKVTARMLAMRMSDIALKKADVPL
jgi:hypothetical protein